MPPLVALTVVLGLWGAVVARELSPIACCYHLSSSAAAADSPGVWAVPTNWSGPVNLFTAGAAPQQLCFTTRPNARSMLLLFKRVRLPAGARLRICPAAPFTASCIELGAGRLLASVPGNTAIISFVPGAAGAAGTEVQLAAVLQGLQPLPDRAGASAAEAVQRKVSADRAAALEQALSDAMDTSNLACPYLDVACAGSEWREPAAAATLLLLASPQGARFCTGAVLNTAHLADGAAYILSASHCRGFDTNDDAQWYQAVFNHQRAECPAAGARRLLMRGSSAPAPMLDLQGLQVAWQDEESDVLLLRVDAGIPAEFGAGALGWDASGWAPAETKVVTFSHPRGNLKKVSRSTSGLRRAAYAPEGGQPISGETHYRVQWTQGGSDTGSSGAPLIAASRRQVIGVLTGGEAATCKNRDYFGSLRAAWERGLWRVLSPSGPDTVTSMPSLAPSGPPSSIAKTVDGEAQQAQHPAAEDGAIPSQAIAVQGDEQLNFAADGELRLPATPPSAALAPVRLGQPLASLVPPSLLPLGSIRFYNISSSLTMGDLSVSACAGDRPLQVAFFVGGAATWVSTEPCSLPNGSCAATNATGGCSGLQGLRLPGRGDGDTWPGSEPYTVAVLPLLPWLSGTSVQFELHVTSTYVPAMFAVTGN